MVHTSLSMFMDYTVKMVITLFSLSMVHSCSMVSAQKSSQSPRVGMPFFLEITSQMSVTENHVRNVKSVSKKSKRNGCKDRDF